MSKKNLVFYVAAIAFITHFIIIFSYSAGVRGFVWIYSYPNFEQNWSLFAPPPKTEIKWLLMCKNSDSLISDFIEPKTELMKNAFRNYSHYASYNEGTGNTETNHAFKSLALATRRQDTFFDSLSAGLQGCRCVLILNKSGNNHLEIRNY